MGKLRAKTISQKIDSKTIAHNIVNFYHSRDDDYLLHLERHQYRQALRGEGSERVDFPRPDGQHRIQSVRLLILQRRHLTHVLSRRRQHRFRIQVQLFLGVCGITIVTTANIMRWSRVVRSSKNSLDSLR